MNRRSSFGNKLFYMEGNNVENRSVAQTHIIEFFAHALIGFVGTFRNETVKSSSLYRTMSYVEVVR